MKILALDTATELCSAAIWIDGSYRVREDSRPRAAAGLILGMIAELLAESGLSLGQLDAIAFGRGPGGFTGVRLAVAVAQGLGFSSDLPLLPISDLRALAQQALAFEGAPARALICQDARMSQVYWGCFEWLQGARAVQPEALGAPEAVHLPQHWLDGPVCGAGSGFGAYPALRSIPAAVLEPILETLRPRALEIAELAALDGLACAVAAEFAAPVYLRDEVAALPSQN